ncbi:MAG: cytochrome c oxidase assembly protein [Opitutaceae bacterium]|jgi:putative membrane protein
MIDWTHWHNEPHLIGGLVLLGWLYALFTGPLRERIAPGQPYPRRLAIMFYLGLITFYLAVGSPLDQIGERYLLSGHMVQHIIIMDVSALLCLLGLPSWLVSKITARPGLRSILHFLTRPLICGLVYTLVYSLWHAPALYDWALQNRWVHILEHVMFFGAAIFYWWPIFSPSPEFPRLSYAAQMLYLVGVVIAMTPVFAFIAFSNDILYPTYEFAPRLYANFGPAEDQLLGSVIMKTGGMGVTFIVFIVAFYKWYQASEGRAGQK